MPTRRPSRRLRAALVASLTLVVVGVPAAASAQRSLDRDLLWATVNVCDTEKRPDIVGVRVSMPGSGTRAERMYARILLQYRDGDGDWRRVREGGDSGWIALGHARTRSRQAGRDFEVAPPRGGMYRLRGRVHYQWRRGKDVVRRARRVTTAGHGATAGADPAGASTATCVVR